MEKESLENHNCATPCPNGLWCEVVTCYCGAKYCSHCYSHPDTGVCCSNRSSCMYSVVSCPANCGEHFCTAHQYHFGTVCCPKNTNDGHIYQKCTKC